MNYHSDIDRSLEEYDMALRELTHADDLLFSSLESASSSTGSFDSSTTLSPFNPQDFSTQAGSYNYTTPQPLARTQSLYTIPPPRPLQRQSSMPEPYLIGREMQQYYNGLGNYTYHHSPPVMDTWATGGYHHPQAYTAPAWCAPTQFQTQQHACVPANTSSDYHTHLQQSMISLDEGSAQRASGGAVRKTRTMHRASRPYQNAPLPSTSVVPVAPAATLLPSRTVCRILSPDPATPGAEVMCGQTCDSRTLRKHITKVHGIGGNKNSKKDGVLLECRWGLATSTTGTTSCSSLFGAIGDLKRHILEVHGGVKRGAKVSDDEYCTIPVPERRVRSKRGMKLSTVEDQAISHFSPTKRTKRTSARLNPSVTLDG